MLKKEKKENSVVFAFEKIIIAYIRECYVR